MDDDTEVLVPGCGLLSAFLTTNHIHAVEGVPILEPIAAGIKMAESLIDLRKKYCLEVCRSSIYSNEQNVDWEK